MRKPFFCLVSLLVFSAVVLARDAREQQRIDFLIQSMASLKGAVFIRNGTECDAKAAVAHLRMKLDYGGERIKTAEDFIHDCASESSMTHQKYKIRFPDGKGRESATYFLPAKRF